MSSRRSVCVSNPETRRAAQSRCHPGQCQQLDVHASDRVVVHDAVPTHSVSQRLHVFPAVLVDPLVGFEEWVVQHGRPQGSVAGDKL